AHGDRSRSRFVTGPILLAAGGASGLLMAGVILLVSYLVSGKPAPTAVAVAPPVAEPPSNDKKGKKKPAPEEPPVPPAVAGTMSNDEVYNEMLKSSVWILATDGKDEWHGSGSLVDRDERLVL